MNVQMKLSLCTFCAEKQSTVAVYLRYVVCTICSFVSVKVNWLH